ncbi:hypothetical protein AAFF_G00301460 [Aldrovandia affinis]|uniref:Uncharacterized protein n=1 Tax=Aldrovandia affinis TaxID=143900 RepID=A0AAD7WRH4_9TELE|nr:hypothetical protein AAFF_G00301460 [Aldrovandia affinis]
MCLSPDVPDLPLLKGHARHRVPVAWAGFPGLPKDIERERSDGSRKDLGTQRNGALKQRLKQSSSHPPAGAWCPNPKQEPRSSGRATDPSSNANYSSAAVHYSGSFGTLRGLSEGPLDGALDLMWVTGKSAPYGLTNTTYSSFPRRWEKT